MAIFKPFRAVRPVPEHAAEVAALPYDVMNSEEARIAVQGNPYSFLHVDKAEIDLPRGTDPYSPEVYEKAASNLRALEENGICLQDQSPMFYIYRQTMNGKEQTGLVGCASIQDYLDGIIKRHELTRAEKEEDRVKHVTYCNANTGPIFLAYRSADRIHDLIESWKAEHDPIYDFVSEDPSSKTEVFNTVWVITDPAVNEELTQCFDKVESLYIADGHHRCASAARVGQNLREAHPDYTGQEEFNFFLAVVFPADELSILDYNRVVLLPNGMDKASFFAAVEDKFFLDKTPMEEPYHPEAPKTFGLYLEGKWYKLTAKPGTYNAGHPVDSLDVSILQNNLLGPLLHIGDPRTDPKIDFVGGIRGLKELERRCQEDMDIAFSMYPTSLDELMNIADAGLLMPPKSTWFEPKLLSGLFVHKFDR
ncbi:MAG TPA: DUF1015 family protein [Clostridiales bacterium]|nr:DUF1015 family protein [Clostridiales bacterium]